MPQQVINGVGKAGIRISTGPVVTYDTDAQSFLTAAGITATTQVNAVNELVKDLKSANIWTKMKAVYPMVGGTAATHKWNLKDPRDTNDAFRLVFNGGWSHSSTGAQGNDTNGWAETFVSATSHLTPNPHIGYYTTDIGTKSYKSLVGIQENANKLSLEFNSSATYCRIGGSFVGYSFISYANSGLGLSMLNLGPTLGWQNSKYVWPFQLVRNSTIGTDVLNYQTYGAVNLVSELPSTTISLNGIKYFQNGSYTVGSNVSGTKCGFASLGTGLTTTEVNLYYRIVEKFQVALGRNTNASLPYYYNNSYSLNTNLFFINAGITNATQQSAVGTLVNTLTTAGIWSKMKAVYPFVGGTANAHKFNLVNPSAYNLTFNGGGTHDANGYQTNGSNSLADTNLTPSTTLTLNSTHVSIYSRTNNAGIYSDLGTQDMASRTISMFIRSADNSVITRINEGFNPSVGTNSDSRGFYIGSRTASNVRKTYINNTLFNTNSTPSVALPISKIAIGANYYNNIVANSNYFSNRQYAFSSIGDGLTDAEALTFYNAVQAFQTTLGRQV